MSEQIKTLMAARHAAIERGDKALGREIYHQLQAMGVDAAVIDGGSVPAAPAVAEPSDHTTTDDAAAEPADDTTTTTDDGETEAAPPKRRRAVREPSEKREG